MIHLKYIPPTELSQTDLEWLDKFVQKWSYDGSTTRDYIERIVSDKLAVFRLEGDCGGLVGFELVSRPHGKELWLEFISGHSVLEHLAEAFEVAETLGKRLGAKKFFVSSAREGMTDKAIKTTDLKKVATILGKDL